MSFDADVTKALRSHLLTVPAFKDIGVFPDAAPQAVQPPFITYSIISDQHMLTTTGLAGMSFASIQFEVVTNKRKDTGSLARQLLRAFTLLRGQVGDVWLDSVFVNDGPRTYELQPTGGQEEYRYVCGVMIGAYYLEYAPT